MVNDPRGLAIERKSLSKGVVTLAVGEDHQSIVVHKELLCENSPFFAAALKEDWKEGREGTIPLPDDDPEVVDIYTQWLYTDKILVLAPSMPGQRRQGYNTLVDAFIFGDKVQDGDFRDAIIDALISATNIPDFDGECSFPDSKTVDRAFGRTLDGSPLRRLLAEMIAFHGNRGWALCNNVDFLRLLVETMFEIRHPAFNSDPTHSSADSCQFHHHAEDSLCYSPIRR